MNEDNDIRVGRERARAAFDAACRRLAYAPDAGPGRPPPPSTMADRIEHTLLGMDAGDEQVRRLCDEARAHRFRSVCCLPRDVGACRELLDGAPVLVVTVLDFPLAGADRELPPAECRAALAAGADEVDLVVDVRALRAGKLAVARDGVARVVDAAAGHPVKVILETGLLTAEQIMGGCAAAEAAGAAYVKTCTGFGPRGATVADIELMRLAVGERLGIKASGGIRGRDDALRLVDAGADLIGTSAGPACL